MPNKLFASSYLKVERANKHIEDFKSAWDTFLEDNPHSISFEKQVNTGKTIVKVNQPPIPANFSTIVGDAVHNLRTALDHLACQLVRMNGGKDVSETVFPLGANSRKDFEARIKGVVKGASKDAWNILESVEAYKGGHGEALSSLGTLDVLDKHIGLLLASQVFTISRVTVTNSKGGSIEFHNCRVHGGSFNLASVGGEGKVTIEDDGNSTVDIVFRKTEVFEGESVIKTLKQLSQLVLGIVDTFEAEFG